jgi:1,4-dihydroxy-2-naphthoate octaprenyltransferase
MDKDETPIGGLSRPLQPTRQLFYASIIMDSIALLLAAYLNRVLSLGILIYILASRAYSYRRIRLKKYPITGFITVFLCQGALVYFITSYTVQVDHTNNVSFLCCFIAGLLIGALYPLTQIYQHEADIRDGVITLSYLLGKRGTFIFSGGSFILATVLLFIRFYQVKQLNNFVLFLLIMLPVVLYFMYWMHKVWNNEAEADFRHSLYMNILSTTCTASFFITLIIQNH